MSESVELTAGAPPSPYDRPAEFLLSRGWKPLGPISSERFLDRTTWLSPYQPHNTLGKYTKIPVTRTDPETGEEVPVTVKNTTTNRNEPVLQTNWIPPAEPVSLWFAIQHELDRDAALLRRAEAAPAETREQAEAALQAARRAADEAAEQARRAAKLCDELERLARDGGSVAAPPAGVAAAENVRRGIEAEAEAASAAGLEKAGRLAEDAANRQAASRGGLPPFPKR